MPDRSTTCGLFGWRPSWLQPWLTQRSFLIVYLIISLVQSMIFSYLTVVLSTGTLTYPGFNGKIQQEIMFREIHLGQKTLENLITSCTKTKILNKYWTYLCLRLGCSWEALRVEVKRGRMDLLGQRDLTDMFHRVCARGGSDSQEAPGYVTHVGSCRLGH